MYWHRPIRLFSFFDHESSVGFCLLKKEKTKVFGIVFWKFIQTTMGPPCYTLFITNILYTAILFSTDGLCEVQVRDGITVK